MRVLVVDPSRTVQKFVTRLLEARGHDVRAFSDPRAALDYLKFDTDVGALITSAELQAISGIELCWEARLIATNERPIYIILMSSNSDQRSLVEALDCGADDFIGKPPVAEELYARLRAAERLASMQHDLVRLASTDPLTGVPNRRAFFAMAEAAVDGLEQDGGGDLSAIVIDIDHFKRVNDVYGHEVGDSVICSVAHIIAEEGRILGRLGGEEFALVLDGVALKNAVDVAERMRLKVAALQIETDIDTLTLTASFGVSFWEAGDTIDHILRRADVALYAVKTGGRNRVIASDAVHLSPDQQPTRCHFRVGPRAPANVAPLPEHVRSEREEVGADHFLRARGSP